MAAVDLRKNPLIWLTFFILCLLASAVKSDLFGCRGVQCPPEITCPNDSVLHMTYEPPENSHEKKNSIYNRNPRQIKNSEKSKRHNMKFLIEKNNENPYDHFLNKRSLQYKRRESIKIVPGDYISLVPESARYHHQLHQNQHKWKRNVDDHMMITNDHIPPIISDNKDCCPQMYCMCGPCPKPKCHGSNKVPQMIMPGSDIPGNCCAQYQCIDTPDCDNVPTSLTFLINQCTNCTCIAGQRICHNQCGESQVNQLCFSETLSKFFSNGQFWKEGDCTQCECIAGEKRCRQSFCKPLDCKNKIKIPGECCQQCALDINTTTVFPTKGTIIKDNINETSSRTIKVSTPETVRVSSTSSTIQPTTECDDCFPNKNEYEFSFNTISTSSENPLETSSPILSRILISTTPEITSTLSTTISNFDDDNSTSSNRSLLPQKYDYDTESIILYTVIVVLLVGCCIFAGLYIREITKKRTYSSIPNSDSNLSQVQRSKIQESA